MNPNAKNIDVLFSCYAPVHFLCFKPILDWLSTVPGVTVHLSGGLREKRHGIYHYDAESLYGPFGVDHCQIQNVEELAERDYDVLFAANSKPILPRKVGCSIQLFHGLSFRNRAVRATNVSFDYYFLIGPYMEQRFIEAGLLAIDDPRAVRIGFPKTDKLLNAGLDRQALLEAHGFGGDRPVILYAPTGQVHNSMETMGEEVIERIVESDRYDLLIKLHDHPKNGINWPRRLKGLENEHCLVTTESDVAVLLYLADLLISDASSVTNEYTLLDRPMIFLDTPELLAAEEKNSSSMLDMDRGRWIGHIVHHPSNIVEAIDLQLAAPDMFSCMRRKRAAELFYNPGAATDAAIDWLQRYLINEDAGTPEALKRIA